MTTPAGTARSSSTWTSSRPCAHGRDCPTSDRLEVSYVPGPLCIELKSLKYYLLSYTGVGIVQEHAANRILRDLVEVCQPVRMSVVLDYNVRGGLHTTVTARYEED